MLLRVDGKYPGGEMSWPTWVPFREYTDVNRLLPAERRDVLVMLRPEPGQRQGVAVGYLRYSAGELNLPFFVVPGIGGIVTHWCDCLGDDFDYPGRGSIRPHGRPARGPYTSPPCTPVAPVPQSRACVDPKCPLVHPHFTLARRTPVAR